MVYASGRLLRLLGVPAESLLGTPFESYVVPADRAALAKVLSGDGAQVEVRLARAGSEPVQALLSRATLADGQSMWLVTDLSEAKRHQASDERTRKFLGMLAHEFRNMLNTMHLSLEIVKRHELNAECRKAVETVERQMDRMLQVVEDLRRVNPKD
jgi:signal transduction histidine kinase